MLQSDEEGGTTDHLREKFAVFVLVQKRQFLSVWLGGVGGEGFDSGETAHTERSEVCDV